MRLALISLDMMVALPLLFLAMTSLFGYAYESQSHVTDAASQLEGMMALYLNSSRAYNYLTSGAQPSASLFPMRLQGNETAYLYGYNASPAGCAIQYACRIAFVSGNSYILVLR